MPRRSEFPVTLARVYFCLTARTRVPSDWVVTLRPEELTICDYADVERPVYELVLVRRPPEARAEASDLVV
jgi:hypothetical protein